jgi:hypothetical protein
VVEVEGRRQEHCTDNEERSKGRGALEIAMVSGAGERWAPTQLH